MLLRSIVAHEKMAAKSGVCVLGFGVRASVGRVPAYGSRSAFDPVREAGARTGSRTLHASVLIATFRCDAPAHCGAFAEERPGIPATPGRDVRRGRSRG